jgi:glycine betaine/proline transport system permease protein
MLLGIGRVPGVIAVVIYALPPMIRLTNLGIRMVDRDVLEAADAFGSSSWQKLRNVQLPLALPTIMAGINQTIMMALAMVVIASMIGVQGLGQPVLKAIANQYFTLGVFNGLAIVGIAIIFDRISQAMVCVCRSTGRSSMGSQSIRDPHPLQDLRTTWVAISSNRDEGHVEDRTEP